MSDIKPGMSVNEAKDRGATLSFDGKEVLNSWGKSTGYKNEGGTCQPK